MPRGSQSDQDAFKTAERLAGHAGGSVAAGLSPNDILVQIALPLVLILAIATRLITMGQAMSDRQRSAVVLDLWKQQLILRMEQVLGEWERDAYLAAFPSAAKIDWIDRWPEDDRFQVLCRKTHALSEIDTLTEMLYQQALAYVPSASNTESAGAFFPLYDPHYQNQPDASMVLDEEFIMTSERRDFALGYLRERCMKWETRVSALQWEVVTRVVDNLPPEHALSDGRISTQMKKIAAALENRGYPLLKSVAEAYGH